MTVAVLALAGALGLAACGSGGSSDSGGLQQVRIALDYSANVNYLGIYAAIHNGYFKRAGIEPVIVPYAETPAETLIETGKADLGISYPAEVLLRRSQGLKYKAVGALVDGDTTALAVPASSPYSSPAQLNGKLFGGFGIESEKPIVETIMRDAGVKRPDFREVVLNTGVIQALGAHRIDYTSVFAGIDDITARLEGVELRLFPWRKYLGEGGNFPNAVYVASDQEIEQRAHALRGALKALAEGYEYAAAHPARAERILIEENETALGKSTPIVTATGNATAKTFVGPSGRWGTMTPQDFTGLEHIFSSSGLIKGHPLPVSDFYTNSLLPSG